MLTVEQDQEPREDPIMAAARDARVGFTAAGDVFDRVAKFGGDARRQPCFSVQLARGV
jgi:hypothetical protein